MNNPVGRIPEIVKREMLIRPNNFHNLYNTTANVMQNEKLKYKLYRILIIVIIVLHIAI